MKVFSLKKFKKDRKDWKKSLCWAEQCDGQPVKGAICKGKNGVCFTVCDDWCEEVPENKKEFNVGDRVKANSMWSGKDIDGEIGTIIESKNDYCLVQFDKNIDGHCGFGKIKGKDGHCLYVPFDHLERITPDKLIFKGNETILIKDGKKYVSKCQDGDVYDKEKGLLLCLAKANGVSYDDLQKMIDGAEDKNKEMAVKIGACIKAMVEAGRKAWEGIDKEVKSLKDFNNANVKPEAEKTVKELNRRAKNGEYIKVVAACGNEMHYRDGDIFKVIDNKHAFNGVKVALPDGIKCGNTGKKWHYIYHSEYVVLENYKPYKITLSEFWKSKDKLAIHCKTEDEAKELLKAFDKAGKKWGSFERYTAHTNWSENGENTLYYNCNTYGNIKLATNTTIYEFNDVDLNN